MSKRIVVVYRFDEVPETIRTLNHLSVGVSTEGVLKVQDENCKLHCFPLTSVAKWTEESLDEGDS